MKSVVGAGPKNLLQCSLRARLARDGSRARQAAAKLRPRGPLDKTWAAPTPVPLQTAYNVAFVCAWSTRAPPKLGRSNPRGTCRFARSRHYKQADSFPNVARMLARARAAIKTTPLPHTNTLPQPLPGNKTRHSWHPKAKPKTYPAGAIFE